MKKTNILILIIVIVVMVVFSQSFFILQEPEQAIVLQFGRYVRSDTEAGLHLKLPFIQNVVIMEKRVVSSDAAPSEYITKDMKRVEVDHITRWRIKDPHEFYKSVRTRAGALTRLDDIVTGRFREEVARHDFVELIRDEREKVMDNVTEEARLRAEDLGVEILDTRIKRLDLPREVERSVFDRMEAERERMAKRYRAEGEEEGEQIRAEADRDKEILLARAFEESEKIRGKGDARSAAIYAGAYEQYPDVYSFTRRLEVYEDIIPNARLLLPLEDDLFRFLRGTDGESERLTDD